MLFNITLQNKNDTKIWKYDTKDNSLTDENNEKIENLTLFNSKENKNKEKKLAIQLGFSCNMSCSYCLQSKTKKTKFNQLECDTLIEKLLKLDLTNTRLEFWGGEPLLYFKEIVYIVRKLKSKKHLPSSFLIITNGLLLTVRMVKFLLKMNFNLAISHDAQSQDIRGKNPFEIPSSLEAIKYLYELHKNGEHRFSINSVITKDNISTENRFKYFAKYLGENENGDIILPHGGEGPVYNSDIDLLNIETLNNDVYTDVVFGAGMYYGYYYDAVGSFINNLGKRNISNITTKCGIDNESKYSIIDIHGKDLSCHNYDFKFKIITLQENDICLKCPVVQLCKSSCPAIDKSSDLFKKNCTVMFNTNMGLLRAIIEIITVLRNPYVRDNEEEIYRVTNIQQSISSTI